MDMAEVNQIEPFRTFDPWRLASADPKLNLGHNEHSGRSEVAICAQGWETSSSFALVDLMKETTCAWNHETNQFLCLVIQPPTRLTRSTGSLKSTPNRFFYKQRKPRSYKQIRMHFLSLSVRDARTRSALQWSLSSPAYARTGAEE